MSRSDHMELFEVRNTHGEFVSLEPNVERATASASALIDARWHKIVVPLRREELCKFLTTVRPLK